MQVLLELVNSMLTYSQVLLDILLEYDLSYRFSAFSFFQFSKHSEAMEAMLVELLYNHFVPLNVDAQRWYVLYLF